MNHLKNLKWSLILTFEVGFKMQFGHIEAIKANNIIKL